MVVRNNIKYSAVWFLIETWLDVVIEWNRVYGHTLNAPDLI